MIAVFSVFLTKCRSNFPPITFSFLFPTEHLLRVFPCCARSCAQASLLSDSISSRSLCAGPALCRRGSSISRMRAPSPSECVRKVGLFNRHGRNNLTFLSPQSSSWCSVFFILSQLFFPWVYILYLNVIFMQCLPLIIVNVSNLSVGLTLEGSLKQQCSCWAVFSVRFLSLTVYLTIVSVFLCVPSSLCRVFVWRQHRQAAAWLLCLRDGKVQSHFLRELVGEDSSKRLST